MGNTPSRDKQYNDIYNSYLQQQQDLIFKQQNQINSLYQMNLDSQQRQQTHLSQDQQSVPPNLLFQSDTNPTQPNVKKLTSGKYKLDPYKILNVTKDVDEKTLKRAYLKAAMKSHPDRGGSKSEFQKLSIAYTLLKKKIKESQNSHDHNELRGSAKDFYSEQSSNPKVNTRMTENFDVDLFNKIYEENKIPEAFDDGYGSWMEKSSGKELENPKMFGNGFNKDLFNHTFEEYKKDQAKKTGTQQLTKYTEPQQRISMNNQDSIMVLGQGKVSDFGGTTDNLAYTDYKQAFTHGSTLIDTSTVDISGRSTSIGGIKSQRSNISFTMNDQDQKLFSLQELDKQKSEENRLKRLQVYDQRTKDSYEKIHSLLLR